MVVLVVPVVVGVIVGGVVVIGGPVVGLVPAPTRPRQQLSVKRVKK